MSQYVDSSALLKRYIDEEDSGRAAEILEADSGWITGRHSWIEVFRNLSRLLGGAELLRMEGDSVSNAHLGQAVVEAAGLAAG